MAINTPKPISREEKYLDKIGGNEKVIVPKPISREEKYMYRAAGYNDQPIPDYPIGRNEKYWAKIVENGGGSGNGSTVTFDSGQKFISDNSSLKDYKIYGNGREVHPTGVLPLTFTSKGGTAADWVIEGNDDNGTENLFDYSQGCDWASGSNGASYQKIIAQQGDVFTVTSSSALYALVRGYDANDAIISGSAWSTGGTSTYTAPASIAYVKVVFRNFEYSTITAEQKATINETMLVKGSIAPDQYIPYQHGVGERTRNLFDIGTSASDYVGASIGVEIDGYNLSMNIVRAGGTWTYRNKKILTTGEHTVSLSSDKTYPRIYIALRNQDDSGWLTDSDASISEFTYNSYYHGWYKDNESYTTGNVAISVTIPSCLYWQIGFGYNSIANVGTIGTLSNIMLVKGSTAPDHYIPYGYQIPLTISQQGQPDKTYDIYIGDSPLTEGETVSKTSTGVDIELFEGENTVSTTLYNKPTMEIETSYGVGVKDNNHYIIPFKVNTTIYNIQIGDSPLYYGEYLSYKEKKLYKYIDSVLTPIDPPSPFPEISTTEGVNKVIIETSTQPDSIFITTQNPIKLVQPNIGTKTITQNGVYNASDDNLDGYSSVTVNTN